jgi:hypothetical protein
MPWHGVVLPFSLQQRVAERSLEPITATTTTTTMLFCGNKKIYFTEMLASKMNVSGRGKGQDGE